MRRIISIGVLLVFLMHFLGFYVYFVVRQNQIRHEMRESIGLLSNDEFKIFVFTENEYLKARINDHEVRIDGKMYDHGTPKFEEGKVTLYALHDKIEDKLISFLYEVVNITTQDNKPVPTQLINFLSLTFVSPAPLCIVTSLPAKKIFHHHSEKLLAQNFPVESPPPKA